MTNEYFFNSLSFLGKENYIIEICRQSGDLTFKQFEWCSDNLKIRYIESRDVFGYKNFKLSNKFFNICSDKAKLRYYELSNSLTFNQFEWLNEELKLEYVTRYKSEENFHLSDLQFNWCSDEIKNEYLDYSINNLKKDELLAIFHNESVRNIYLTEYQTNWNKYKGIEYYDKCIAQNILLEDVEKAIYRDLQIKRILE